jgi:putative hemolysin
LTAAAAVPKLTAVGAGVVGDDPVVVEGGELALGLLLVILGLLLLSAYFSGTEAALFSLSRLQLRQIEERRDRASRRIIGLLRDPDQTLSALLVGNNFVNIAFSSIVTAFFLTVVADRSRAIEISFVAATLAILVLGEVTPKTLAVNFSLRFSRAVSGSFLVSCRVLRPATIAFHGMAALVLRVLKTGADPAAGGTLLSRAELRSVFEEVDEEPSVITRSESRLVQNILDFSSRTAEQIMTPRVDIDDLALDAETEEIVAFMRETRHSRYPVYRDDPDNMVGFVQAKEFLAGPEIGLEGLLRPVAFFPENAPVDRIFYEIRRSHTALVIVVNEYGELVGLITREDVIEEIVGDIYDEFDLEEAPIRKKSEGLYILHGRSSLHDLNEALELALPDETAVTLNGFLCEVHGRIPRPGTTVEWRALRFHVLEVARHQVRKVLLEIADRSGEGD